MSPSAEVAIFGGTGFYSFLDDPVEVFISTPYGDPSDRITIGVVGGRRVAFLPRHGRDHTIPPHLVNYPANLWAMRDLGVERVFGPCAVGSLDPSIHPGDIVVCDQFIDRTWGRRSTYYDGPVTTHVSLADPYCPQLRELTWIRQRCEVFVFASSWVSRMNRYSRFVPFGGGVTVPVRPVSGGAPSPR